MREVGNALDEGFEKGVLPVRPGLSTCNVIWTIRRSLWPINASSEYIWFFGKSAGKKIVMSWAYSPSYGKPLSVPQGIIALMSRFGMHIELAYPEGYGLIPK